jgi:hypothetical protein
MDVNGDGVVSPAEMLANELFAALAAPDLDLLAPVDGELVFWPNRDNVRESLSMGLSLHAVPVVVVE